MNLIINLHPLRPLLWVGLFSVGILGVQTSSAVSLGTHPETSSEFQILPSLAQSADYNKAIVLLKQNEYAKATLLGKQYVQNNPTDAKAHLILILGLIGQNEQAALDKHLSELNKQLPKIAAAIEINIAKIYASKDDFVQALRYLPKRPSDEYKLDALHLKASIYAHQGKNNDAIKTYQEIIKQAPADQSALMKLASLYLTDRNYAESESYSKRLVSLAPDSVITLTMLGSNQLLLDKPSEAITTFNKVLKLEDDSPIGLLNLANSYLCLKEYADAQKAFEKLAITYPKTQEGHAGLALTYLAQGKYEQAKKVVEMAADVNPNYPVTHLVKAALSLTEDDLTRANIAYKKVGDIYIDFQRPGFDASNYFQTQSAVDAINLATSVFFSEQGYLALALHVINNASYNDTSAPFLSITKARLTWKLGQAEQAQTILHNVSVGFPQLVTPVVESADIAYFSGKPKAALNGYKKALQLAPELIILQAKLGNLYNALGASEKAVKEYQAYLSKNKHSAYVLNQLAATLTERMNMPEKALPYALQAQKIDPDSARIMDTLGDIYFRLGRHNESLEQYKEIANKSPVVDPNTYYRMGLNYLGLHDKNNAVIFIGRAINTGKFFALRNEAIAQLTKLKGS